MKLPAQTSTPNMPTSQKLLRQIEELFRYGKKVAMDTRLQQITDGIIKLSKLSAQETHR